MRSNPHKASPVYHSIQSEVTSPTPSAYQPRLLACAVLMALLAACASPRRSRLSTTEGANGSHTQYTPSQSGPPPWADQPHSWEKLETINTWLRTQGPRSEPFWRVEGRLLLAEGRLEFYRSERSTVKDSANAQRMASARADFLRVRSDPEASEAQLRRAGRGLTTSAGFHTPKKTASALPPGVLPRSRWGARPAMRSNLTPTKTPWRYITIHHSALENPIRSVNTAAGAQNALRKMQNYHMDNNGWGDLGYHFLISPLGQVYEGRPMRWQGAHAGRGVRSNNNIGNIGICLIGNFDKDHPSAASLKSLEQLVGHLRGQHRIPADAIRAHQDWKQTECPGHNLMPFVRQLARS